MIVSQQAILSRPLKFYRNLMNMILDQENVTKTSLTNLGVGKVSPGALYMDFFLEATWATMFNSNRNPVEAEEIDVVGPILNKPPACTSLSAKQRVALEQQSNNGQELAQICLEQRRILATHPGAQEFGDQLFDMI